MFSSFAFGTPFGMQIPQTFQDFFRCYPISMMPESTRKESANYGGKIFLPPSALNKLTMLNISYPMIFELSSDASGLQTHSGVLEFTAEEGRCYLPQWMMTTLQLIPGAIVKLRNVELPLGKFVKIEPQSTDFLDISDPKAVLENVLRNFTTLTVDDVIEINYNEKTYGIKILETKPETASKSICVVETDLETDFAPPVGYVEPDYEELKKENEAKKGERKKEFLNSYPAIHGKGAMATKIGYQQRLHEADLDNQIPRTFQSQGVKLSGKSVQDSRPSVDDFKVDLNGEPLPLDLPDGQMFFGFPVIPPKEEGDAGVDESKPIFQGQGQSLRKSKKRKDQTAGHQSLKSGARSPDFIEID